MASPGGRAPFPANLGLEDEIRQAEVGRGTGAVQVVYESGHILELSPYSCCSSFEFSGSFTYTVHPLKVSLLAGDLRVAYGIWSFMKSL